MKEDLKGVEIPDVTDYGHDQADNFRIASFGSGEMQGYLEGVEIPENPDYGHDKADKYNYGHDEADKYNNDYPRTRVGRSMTCLV